MKRIAVLTLAFLAACGGGPSKPKPLSGALLVADPAGDTADAVNAVGKKPEHPLASADILGVRIDVTNGTMRLRIAIADTPANHLPLDDKEGPDWFLQLWPTTKETGAPAYFLAIVRQGDVKVSGNQLLGWRLSVCPGTQVCTTQATGAKLAIVGKEVRADIPLTLLPKLQNPFSWIALSYWNSSTNPVDAWSDYVPDNARPAPASTAYPAPSVRATFPPPSQSPAPR